MPTRFIHSRSSLIPSFVMFPFIQCHQTRGFAESGGFRKPLSSVSEDDCPARRAPRPTLNKKSGKTSFTRFRVLHMKHLTCFPLVLKFPGRREMPGAVTPLER